MFYLLYWWLMFVVVKAFVAEREGRETPSFEIAGSNTEESKSFLKAKLASTFHSCFLLFSCSCLRSAASILCGNLE